METEADFSLLIAMALLHPSVTQGGENDISLQENNLHLTFLTLSLK